MVMDVFAVELTGSEEALRHFFFNHPAEPRPIGRQGAQIRVRVLLPQTTFEKAKADPSLEAVELYNASERGRLKIQAVSGGNRFAGGRIPRGLGVRIR